MSPLEKVFFEKNMCHTGTSNWGKSGEWYFFKWAQSSFSDKQIKTASKNTECFVENALAMLNIRVMTHPRSPFMVRQARQPGGSGRRTVSGFADAISDWSRLTNLAVPVAGPRAGSRMPPRTGAGSPTGRFRSPDRERVRGCHLGLEQASQPCASGRRTEKQHSNI